MDPDIQSLLINKFKDINVRRKLLEDTFDSFKLVLDHSEDNESKMINIYFHDVVQNKAKLLVDGILIYKIAS